MNRKIQLSIGWIAGIIVLFGLILFVFSPSPVKASFWDVNVNITADDTNINYEDSTRIRWDSDNADYCLPSGGTNNWNNKNINTSGTFNTGSLTSDKTFRITCYNDSDSAGDSITIRVNDQNNYQANTSVTISADRTRIAYNENTVIRWYPKNATYCAGSGGSNGWAGIRNAFSGSFNTGPLAYTTTYTISCGNYYNNYGNYNDYDTRSVTVVVRNQNQTANSLTATTTGATQISNTSAQLNSLIANSGNDSVNSWFEWGRTVNLGNKTATTAVGALPSVIHADTLSGLSPGTTYYFRAIAENSLWRNIGSVLSFTTSGQQNTVVFREVAPKKTVSPTSLVLMTSSVDRNQPIVPTLDNTRPHPGDEINYAVNYQNIGTGAITNLILQIALPQEVNYVFSNGSNPNIFGNTLVFNLGTLKANSQSAVTTRVRVLDYVAAGTILNFPATLSYVDPSGQPKSVSANVSAQVWNAPAGENITASLGANVIGSNSFFPINILGWLLLIILILVLILLSRHLYSKFLSEKQG